MMVNERRDGMFWDVMEGRRSPPPAAQLLGWELREIDPAAGTIAVAFDAGTRFTNPVGVVQGGFLAAMLDDTLGPALVATLGPDEFRTDDRPARAVPAPGPAGSARRPRAGRAPRRQRRVPRRRVVRRGWSHRGDGGGRRPRAAGGSMRRTIVRPHHAREALDDADRARRTLPRRSGE